ncbi:hypothetical protein BDB01DRAFT_774227 [Pilobolus umbonatus]|nr:hypothetical protein BDB01DRAFT_774227 [Pilobolus umbonatus]
MKITLDSHSDRFQIVELRLACIPTAWAQRTGIIRVFELLVFLHSSRNVFPRAFPTQGYWIESMKGIKLVREFLVRQQNQIMPIEPGESLRYML